MATFRILHLSDLHLARVAESLNIVDAPSMGAALRLAIGRSEGTAEKLRYRFPTTYDPAALCDVARHAFNDQELDLILITGDIATTGDELDLAPAAAFVTAAATGAWMAGTMPTLSAARTPVALLPGNHDRYEHALFPFGTGATRFDDLFNEFWWCGQSAVPLGVIVKENENLALIGADFSLRPGNEDPISAAGKGDAYPHIVKTLRLHTRRLRELFARRQARLAIIWAIHFAPEFEGGDPNLQLRNEHALVRAAGEDNVALIACGHTHQSRTYYARTAPVRICCAGTAGSYRARNGNVIHTREVDISNGVLTGLRTTDHTVGII